MKHATAILIILASAGLLLPEPGTRHVHAPVVFSAQGQAGPTLDVIGGDPKVVKVAKVIEVDATVYTSFPITLKAPPGFGYVWRTKPPVMGEDNGDEYVIESAPKGPVVVSVRWSEVDFKAEKITPRSAQRTIDVIGIDPPAPPDPPKPDPKPAVIEGDGLHLLMIDETRDRAKLSKGHQGILFDADMREYYRTVAPGEGDDRHWYFWDQQFPAGAYPKKWQDAMARPRASLPWLIVSNKAKGSYEGPLPADKIAMKSLVEKYR